MPDFRNAYHFVPRLKPTPETLLELPQTQASFGLTPQTATFGHAVYAEGAHSGRLRCRITLETPMVIGAAREGRETEHTVVDPFLFEGRPAVPATSIKGVISSIAEAASMAPFRVLENMKLTIRTVQTHEQKSMRKSAGDVGVNMGHTHAYFAPENLPSSLSRNTIHLVDAMFGFVRMDGSKTRRSRDGGVVSVAGKLRFSHALLATDNPGQDITDLFVDGVWPKAHGALAGQVGLTRLKEQSQPMKEPPNKSGLRSATPNFYFKRKSAPDEFIDKGDFAFQSPEEFEPQGGKFYLHYPDGRTGEPWKTADKRPTDSSLKRKAAVMPLKVGTQFEFTVDFDNLTIRELELLCFSLGPTPKFRHKIGLGKALGLGSIRIDVLECALVDRRTRYSEKEIFEEDPRSVGAANSVFDTRNAAENHLSWLQKRDPGALVALLAIGETHAFDGVTQDANVPVLWVPLTGEKLAQKDPSRREEETYEWFSENDKRFRQKLEPIHRRDYIPMLGTSSRPGRNAQMNRPPPQPTMLRDGERRGELKFFKEGKGLQWFGYIKPDDGGGDVFIDHAPGMAAGLNTVASNARRMVAFTTVEDEVRGEVAGSVRKL